MSKLMVGYVFDNRRGVYFPASMAAYAAGKDAYLRKCKALCCECGAEYIVGRSDGHDTCQACYDIGGLENSLADGSITEEEYFSLVKEIKGR